MAFMSARERGKLVNFRVSEREWAAVTKAAKGAGLSVTNYIMQRIGVSSLAAASEVSEVLDAIRSGKETDPFAALTKLMSRYEYHARLYVEIAKARSAFQSAASVAVSPLAELAREALAREAERVKA